MRRSWATVGAAVFSLALGCDSSGGSSDGETDGGESSGGATSSSTPTTSGTSQGSASSASSTGVDPSGSEGDTGSTATSDSSDDTSGGDDESSGTTGEPPSFDPEPAGGTFFGDSQFERIQGVHVDEAGYIYLGGTTHSASFPATPGAFQTSKNGPDGNANQFQLSEGYVAKLSPDGSSIEWATFLGGSARESVYAVRTDSAGNVYAVGATGSADFPTTAGAFDPSVNGPTGGASLGDAFVVRLSSDGSTMDFGTVVGGAGGGEENPRGSIVIDEDDDRLYVSGITASSNFPTTAGSLQPNYGGGANDGFVFALSLDGGTLIAATYLGGNGSDMAYSKVSLHPDGSVLVAGATSSTNFPVTEGAFQPTLASGGPSDNWYEDGDAFVARLSDDLSSLVFSSYLGGNDSDAVGHNQGMGVDSQGRIVVAGSTSSSDFPVTAGAYADGLAGGPDGFVAVIAQDGSSIEYATYVGGSGADNLSTMFVGPDDRVYVTGTIGSDDWPVTSDAMQPDFGNGSAGGGVTDAVLTVFDPSLSSLEYSTYLGGSGSQGGAERGRSIWATDTAIYIAGATDSADFPTLAPSVQPDYGGGVDGFLVWFTR